MTLTLLSLAGRRDRQLAAAMAAAALVLVLVAIVLTGLLSLAPCHLCIFQRVLYLSLAALFLAAAIGWPLIWLRRAALLLAAGVAIGGMFIAGEQSWLQWFPETALGCAGGQPGTIELLVEWLGQQSPMLFLATGYCESKELVVLWLSLANWSFIAYAALLCGALVLLFFSRRERQSS
ncbi:MAG: disulfide bond formation protein B [Rhodocyclaceae bacterium]